MIERVHIMVWDASSGFFIRTDSEQVRYYYSTDGLLNRTVICMVMKLA